MPSKRSGNRIHYFVSSYWKRGVLLLTNRPYGHKLLRVTILVLPYSPDFIPHHRRGAEALLASVQWDPERLTHQQQAAIALLYFLNDPRSVADRVRAGEAES